MTRYVLLMSLLVLAGCATHPEPEETPRYGASAAQTTAAPGNGKVSVTGETTMTAPSTGTMAANENTRDEAAPRASTTGPEKKRGGEERWLCRDRSDWDQSERFHLVAVRLGILNPEADKAMERAESDEEVRLLTEIMDTNLRILEAAKGSELTLHERLLAILSLSTEIGTISVAGETHIAVFEIEGINRRWNWSPHENGGYDDSLIVRPSGDASYVNFRRAERDDEGTRSAIPEAFFECEQS